MAWHAPTNDLLFYTAVRVSELVHIEVGDVDLEACKIFINRGKGAKDRYILFPASFRLVLKSHLHAAPRNREQVGVGVIVGLCSALFGKPLKGGLVICGGITLGGSIEPIHNPIDVVELAMEKGANAVLVPVSSRRALIDLSDEVATKVQVLFYADASDALRKALHE